MDIMGVKYKASFDCDCHTTREFSQHDGAI